MHERPHQLLLVEEDEVLAEVTAFRLELLGYQVRCAQDGAEALRQVDSSLPDLILLDSTLPDMDGVELIERLSNDPQTSGLPIVVFSIDANLEAVQRAYAAGARDYIVTPYDPAVLEHKIETLLSKVMTTS